MQPQAIDAALDECDLLLSRVAGGSLRDDLGALRRAVIDGSNQEARRRLVAIEGVLGLGALPAVRALFAA